MAKRDQTAKDFWDIVKAAADANASPSSGMNFSRGFDAITPEYAKRIIDSEIFLLLEEIQTFEREASFRKIRALLLAEQDRRANEQHNQLFWITVATLVVAVAGVIATLAA